MFVVGCVMVEYSLCGGCIVMRVLCGLVFVDLWWLLVVCSSLVKFVVRC